MELSNFSYTPRADQIDHLFNCIGALGIIALGVMLISCAVWYFYNRPATVSMVESETPPQDDFNDLLFGFGLEDFHVDEGLRELEAMLLND